MELILTRCGYRCDLCLAYRPNIEAAPANRQQLSNGWHTYFGFCVPLAAICCAGCMAENPQRIDTACPVRPCVIARGLEHCAQCAAYKGCEKLAERLVVFEALQARLGMEISEAERARFIRPYENKRRLEALR